MKHSAEPHKSPLAAKTKIRRGKSLTENLLTFKCQVAFMSVRLRTRPMFSHVWTRRPCVKSLDLSRSRKAGSQGMAQGFD